MKKSLKVLFGVSALALLFTAAPVMAAEFETNGDNTTTGSNSDNENEFEIESEVVSEVENDAEIDNEAEVDTETGDNDVEDNTTVEDFTTGEMNVTGEWETVANAGAVLRGADDGSLSGEANFVNDTTGSDSENENELDLEHEVQLELDNDADFWNMLDFWGESGDNDVEDNTTVGGVETGSGMLELLVGSWANNDAGWEGAGASSLTLDLTGENTVTGSDSENENEFDIESEYEVDIDNDAEVDNEFEVDIQTGDNDIERNTTVDGVTTGDGHVMIGAETIVNSGGSMAGGNGGGVGGTAHFVNDTTGSDSENENELDLEHEVDIEIDNDAEVNNEADVEVNSGDNDVEDNTTVGDITTGDAHVELNFFNEVNSN